MSSAIFSKREPGQCEPGSEFTYSVTSGYLDLIICHVSHHATPNHRKLRISFVGLCDRGGTLINIFLTDLNFVRKLIPLDYF